MEKLKLENGGWVVVCDGRKAIILRNAGDETYPNLKTSEVREHAEPPTRDLGADKPGRVHTAAVSGRTVRSTVEPTDWHDESERAFLKSLADHLDSAVTAGKTRALVLIAPARALGVLRKAFSPAVKSKLRAEIEHDYVKLPVSEIEQRLFR